MQSAVNLVFRYCYPLSSQTPNICEQRRLQIYDNVLFYQNWASGDGGHLITFVDTVIRDSQFVAGQSTSTSILRLLPLNSAIITASNAGAIYSAGYVLNITSSTFTNNTASNGGAIYAEGNNMTVISTTFSRNKGMFGGAIYQDSAAFAFVKNSVFTENDGT